MWIFDSENVSVEFLNIRDKVMQSSFKIEVLSVDKALGKKDDARLSWHHWNADVWHILPQHLISGRLNYVWQDQVE